MLFGLLGLKRSGKSTVANYLVNNHGFVEKSFADPLKKACKELFLLEDEQLYGTQEDKETPDNRWFGCTPRQMMQFVGTDLLRKQLNVIMPGIHQNLFTYHFQLWIKHNPNLNVVISDVRFQNEVDFIHSLGGKIIKLQRDENINYDDLHESEKNQELIKNYDSFIVNNDTMKELFDNISFIVNNDTMNELFDNISSLIK